MQTRLVQVLDAQLKNVRKRRNLERNINRALNQGIYDRILDNIDPLDRDTSKALARKVGPAVGALMRAANRSVVGFSAISHRNSRRFLDYSIRVEEKLNPSFSHELMDYFAITTMAADGAIQKHLKPLVQEMFAFACEDLFDGRGNLRWDIVKRLHLDRDIEASKAMRDPRVIQRIVSAYYATLVAQITDELTVLVGSETRDTIGYSQSLEAIKVALHKMNTETARLAYMRANQKVNREHEFAMRFVADLNSIDGETVAAHADTLGMLVQADFDAFDDNAYLHQSNHKALADHLRMKKLSFWIDVMYQLAVVERNYVAFSAVFTAFQSNFKAESPEKGKKGGDLLLLATDPEKENAYGICLREYENYQRGLRERGEGAVAESKPLLDENAFIAKLQRYVNARDTYTGIDLVTRSYLHPLHSNRLPIDERPKIERDVMSGLDALAHGGDLLAYENNVGKVLTDAYQKLRVARLDTRLEQEEKDPECKHEPAVMGMLEGILKSGKSAFGAHLLTTRAESLSRLRSIASATDTDSPSSDRSMQSRSGSSPVSNSGDEAKSDRRVMTDSTGSLSSLSDLSAPSSERRPSGESEASPLAPRASDAPARVVTVTMPTVPVRVLFNRTVSSEGAGLPTGVPHVEPQHASRSLGLSPVVTD